MALISERDKREFRDRGLVLREGLLDAQHVDRALEAVWERLSAHGYSAENGWIGKSGERDSSVIAGSKLLTSAMASTISGGASKSWAPRNCAWRD